MRKKKSIWYWLGLTLWTVVGCGAVVLLVSAAKKRSQDVCREVHIDLRGADQHFFINKEEIFRIICAGNQRSLKGKPIRSFDLQAMEERLEKNKWVRNAEIFFDNNKVLQVEVEERIPVARVFTKNNSSFYLDERASYLPLSEHEVARVPVFTSFPSEAAVFKGKDSVLAIEIADLGRYILNDPFWMAQVEQVDINGQEKFELIPKIGHYIIRFGSTKEMEKKFSKLMTFYKLVLKDKGWDYYSVIDIQFNNQVVGTLTDSTKRKTSNETIARRWTAYDSPIQPGDEQEDKIIIPDENVNEKSTSEAPLKSAVTKETGKHPVNENPKPSLRNQLPSPSENKNDSSIRKEERRVPKAVMPKKIIGDDSTRTENGKNDQEL